MKALVVCCLLLFSCSSDYNSAQDITIPVVQPEKDSKFVSNIGAKFKNITEQEFIQTLLSTVSNVKIDSIERSRGIYQIHIDTSGRTSNFITISSISKAIDQSVKHICDTLTFTPAYIGNAKVSSTFTIPLQLSFSNR